MEFRNGSINVDILAKEIERSESFKILVQRWKAFGQSLGVNGVELLDLERKLKLGDVQLKGIVRELLKIWKAEKGFSANWHALREALIACGVHAMAEFLEPPTINTFRFVWQNKLVSLEEMLGSRTAEKCFDLIMIKDKCFNYFTKTPMQLLKHELMPPNPPHNYIQRSLNCFNELDLKIFTSDSIQDQVLLIKGIDKLELARVSNYQAIEESGNQLDETTVNLILLECDEDYDKISKISRKPTHLIQYENGRFFLLKSNMSLELIRPFLINRSREIINEQELVYRICSLSPPCAVSIADSPGMGKTLLLTNIAHLIQETRSQNIIVLFITLQEFVQHINSSSCVVETIATYSSSNEAAKLVFTEMLKSDLYQLYLFLDGYDEVPLNKLDLVDSFLMSLHEVKNAKLVGTSRPHLQTRLEDLCNQFSLQLQPFNEDNQIQFLTKYWMEEHGAKDGVILEKFARQCLLALGTNLTDNEKEIAGIPLQCRILGEIFAGRAIPSSKLLTFREDSVKPISFFGMYKRLVDLKMERVPYPHLKEGCVNAHVYEAIKLLFPSSIETFKPLLKGFDEINESTLCSIGLVEKSFNGKTLKFLHRTFAEYLLAEFIVQNLENHSECIELMFAKIFGERGTYNAFCPDFTSFLKLGNPTTAYFVEMHLKKFKETHAFDELASLVKPTSIRLKRIDVISTYIACCCNDLENLFDLSASVLRFLNLDRNYKKHFKGVPHAVIEGSNNVSLLRKLLNFLDSEFGVSANFHTIEIIDSVAWDAYSVGSPLHKAVEMGKYNMVTYLVQYYGVQQVRTFKYLLHECVRNSNCNSESMIKDKRLIIDMLVNINRDWLEERMDGISANRTPLLETNVHLNLLMHLVEAGANINAEWREGNIIRVRGDRQAFSDLVRWVFSNGFTLNNKSYVWDDRNSKVSTQLLKAIKMYRTIDEDVLNLFYEAGLDFNAQDKYGDSVLFYALKYSESLDLVDKILKLGADVNHANKRGQNAAHILARMGNDESKQVLHKLDLVIENGFDQFDQKESGGKTPLDYTREGNTPWSDQELIALLERHTHHSSNRRGHLKII